MEDRYSTDDGYEERILDTENALAEPSDVHGPCEDAPCCGHGGRCGRALGMSIESYESGWDERSDEEIKQSVYDNWDYEHEDPVGP